MYPADTIAPRFGSTLIVGVFGEGEGGIDGLGAVAREFHRLDSVASCPASLPVVPSWEVSVLTDVEPIV